MASAAPATQSTDLFAEIEHAIIACKAVGKKVIQLLASDVSTLDDTTEKRAKLAGALLVTKTGELWAVPHRNHYYQSTRLRAHKGALTTGTSTYSPEDLLENIDHAHVGLLAPPQGVGEADGSVGMTLTTGTHQYVMRLVPQQPLQFIEAVVLGSGMIDKQPLNETLERLKSVAGAEPVPWRTGPEAEQISARGSTFDSLLINLEVHLEHELAAGYFSQLARRCSFGEEGEGGVVTLAEMAAFMARFANEGSRSDSQIAAGLIADTATEAAESVVAAHQQDPTNQNAQPFWVADPLRYRPQLLVWVRQFDAALTAESGSEPSSVLLDQIVAQHDESTRQGLYSSAGATAGASARLVMKRREGARAQALRDSRQMPPPAQTVMAAAVAATPPQARAPAPSPAASSTTFSLFAALDGISSGPVAALPAQPSPAATGPSGSVQMQPAAGAVGGASVLPAATASALVPPPSAPIVGSIGQTLASVNLPPPALLMPPGGQAAGVGGLQVQQPAPLMLLPPGQQALPGGPLGAPQQLAGQQLQVPQMQSLQLSAQPQLLQANPPQQPQVDLRQQPQPAQYQQQQPAQQLQQGQQQPPPDFASLVHQAVTAAVASHFAAAGGAGTGAGGGGLGAGGGGGNGGGGGGGGGNGGAGSGGGGGGGGGGPPPGGGGGGHHGLPRGFECLRPSDRTMDGLDAAAMLVALGGPLVASEIGVLVKSEPLPMASLGGASSCRFALAVSDQLDDLREEFEYVAGQGQRICGLTDTEAAVQVHLVRRQPDTWQESLNKFAAIVTGISKQRSWRARTDVTLAPRAEAKEAPLGATQQPKVAKAGEVSLAASPEVIGRMCELQVLLSENVRTPQPTKQLESQYWVQSYRQHAWAHLFSSGCVHGESSLPGGSGEKGGLARPLTQHSAHLRADARARVTERLGFRAAALDSDEDPQLRRYSVRVVALGFFAKIDAKGDETYPFLEPLVKFNAGRAPTVEYAKAKHSRASGELGDINKPEHVVQAAEVVEQDLIYFHAKHGLAPLLPDGTFGLKTLVKKADGQLGLKETTEILGKALCRVSAAARRARTDVLAAGANASAAAKEVMRANVQPHLLPIDLHDGACPIDIAAEIYHVANEGLSTATEQQAMRDYFAELAAKWADGRGNGGGGRGGGRGGGGSGRGGGGGGAVGSSGDHAVEDAPDLGGGKRKQREGQRATIAPAASERQPVEHEQAKKAKQQEQQRLQQEAAQLKKQLEQQRLEQQQAKTQAAQRQREALEAAAAQRQREALEAAASGAAGPRPTHGNVQAAIEQRGKPKELIGDPLKAVQWVEDLQHALGDARACPWWSLYGKCNAAASDACKRCPNQMLLTPELCKAVVPFLKDGAARLNVQSSPNPVPGTGASAPSSAKQRPKSGGAAASAAAASSTVGSGGDG